MAIVALNSAATGLSALSTNIDVIANNLANVNTTAFKSSRANFEDLLYEHRAEPGVENSIGDMRPAGLQVGLGTRVSNTQFDFSKGSPVTTNRPLDTMIDGNGLYQVKILESQGNGLGYTRAGNFFRNKDGDLVLGTADGPRLQPPINIPNTVSDASITIASDGTISYIPPGASQATDVGRITLASFANPNGLKSIGGNLYVETAASGPVITGNPGEGSFGSVMQNYLEGSNVDPVTQLVELIKTQRAFEMNSQTIPAADDTLQTVANLKRF
jgi:flagellar basal-body rod protein FlgG